jgi:hypothetical protein
MAGEDAYHRRHRTHDDHAEEPPRTPPRHRIGGYEEEATEDHHVAIRLTIHVAMHMDARPRRDPPASGLAGSSLVFSCVPPGQGVSRVRMIGEEPPGRRRVP